MLKTYNSRPAGTGLHACVTADNVSTLYTDNPEIPQRTGKLLNLSKFDASFFGVHFKQTHAMDPMCRILLEKTYEAIVDAGQQLLCPLVAGKWSWLVTEVVHLEANPVSRLSIFHFYCGNESHRSLPFNPLEAAPSGSHPHSLFIWD